MAFALHLEESLDRRHRQLEEAFAWRTDLRTILTGYLDAVEAAAQTELRTSILLLDESGRHLRHGAAPRLPRSYCDSIDGSEIGPVAGSCGTAAFTRKPVYVTDIENDPLWADYRDIALKHGLRACWSTPIFNGDAILGTFAIYHSTPRSPTPAEVKSIALITDRVGRAIALAREWDVGPATPVSTQAPRLTLVKNDLPDFPSGLEMADTARLERLLEECDSRLEELAASVHSSELAERIEAVARDCRALLHFLRSH